MKRWKLLLVAVVLLVLGMAGLGWLVLPRFYSDDAASSWTYHSPKYGFSMKLPSSDWKEIARPNNDVAFHNRKHSVLVGVNVTKGQREVFDSTILDAKVILEQSRKGLLSEPFVSEGTTDAGNPYVYWTVQSKSDQGGVYFVAQSFVWCKDKALTIRVLMEGPLAMQSDMGKGAERDFYENAVKTICLSAE
jgi:hypothetical protein